MKTPDKSRDSSGRPRRASQGGAGPKHLPSKDAPRAGEFDTRPPASLGKEGARLWRWAVRTMKALGFLDAADREHVRLCAETYQDYCDAKSDIAKHGRLVWQVAGGIKTLKRNPATPTLHSTRLALRSFFSDLGLTPSARAKFGNGSKEDDAFDELLKLSRRN